MIDVVSALTASDNPRDYWYKMKIREEDDAGVELSTVQTDVSGREKTENGKISNAAQGQK